MKLWLDANSNGSTDAGELVSLSAVGLIAIELDFTDAFEHVDEHGNIFKYAAPARFADGRSVLAWAVFLNVNKCSSEVPSVGRSEDTER